jgi:Fe-S cluster biogenesis protein NfuA
MANAEALQQVLQEIIAPLVEADGGELYLVSSTPDEVKLHLAGTCSGCPGAALTTRGVITPALRSINAQLRVTVTTGYLVPDNATRVHGEQRTA